MLELCLYQDINEGDSRGFAVEGHNLFAVKQGGGLAIYLNRCPHRGIGLEWVPDRFLDPDRLFIQCASHGALFSIDTGECITGPCVGQSLTPIAFKHLGERILIDMDQFDALQSTPS